MSVHWLGDYVFVESGVGVRVKFDMVNTVYVTVTSEHLGTTRGLCGVFNNNADGKNRHIDIQYSVLQFSTLLGITELLLCNHHR